MVDVAGDDFGQFGLVGGARLRDGFAPEAGDVFHHQNAELVHPIELSGLFRLDVDAHHVQAEPLEPPGLVIHILVGRIGEMPARMEGLIERAVEIDGFAVEQNPLVAAAIDVARADFPDAKVGEDLVISQFQAALVQIGGIGRPQARIFHGKG